MAIAALILVVLAAIGVAWPAAIAWPFATISVWFAFAFLIRAWRGRSDARRSSRNDPAP